MVFWSYLRYRLRARGRHGTHSPFFYRLAEECLMRRPDAAARKFAQEEGPYSRRGRFRTWYLVIYRLLVYFRPEIVRVASWGDEEDQDYTLSQRLWEAGFTKPQHDDRAVDFLIIPYGPVAWQDLLNTTKLHDGSVMLVHMSNQPAWRESWEALKAHPKVRASADLFHFGLLFFDPAFVAPQHVVLRQRF